MSAAFSPLVGSWRLPSASLINARDSARRSHQANQAAAGNTSSSGLDIVLPRTSPFFQLGPHGSGAGQGGADFIQTVAGR